MHCYDIIVKVEVPDAKDLRPLVTNKIRTLGGVRQTMTVIII
ncbi:MAG: Lrp/AsnC ligand binding domain-containing protein [Candidatus Kariarchaeaceae archaeon]